MRKRILSFVLVFVLILSVAAVAHASSVEYQYSVYKVGSNYSTRQTVSENVQHYQGAANTINYSYSSSVMRFDSADFLSTYRTGLMAEYRTQGFKESLTVPASSGTKTVVPAANTGVYFVELVKYYARGEWSVRMDNVTTAVGTFDNSPVSYTVELSS